MKRSLVITALALLTSCVGSRQSLRTSSSRHAVDVFMSGVSATDASLHGVEIAMSDTVIRIDRMTLHRTDSTLATSVTRSQTDDSVSRERTSPAGGRFTLWLLGAVCGVLIMIWLAGRLR